MTTITDAVLYGLIVAAIALTIGNFLVEHSPVLGFPDAVVETVR